MKQHAKEFEKCLRSVAHRYHIWEVFRDFCELSALALANQTLMNEEREQRYLRTIERYREKEEYKAFPELLGITIEALEDNEAGPTDFLGSLFMSMELSSHWHGQYFTPMPICSMMAKLSLDGYQDVITRRGFITVQDPACGSAAMLIAMAAEMREAGYNPQRQLHATGIDVESTAAHMAYIQLSLLGIQAQIYLGNSLSMEMRERFDTFMHVQGLWDFRLRAGQDAPPLPPEQLPPQKIVEKAVEPVFTAGQAELEL